MSVSVIIPTLNEAACLAETLTLLRNQRPHEIIVVDGGSRDATCEIARAADVLLKSPPGRARQMNLGGARAKGDILIFLHADCCLETGALAAAEDCLRTRHVVAGCFTMQVRAAGLFYRLVENCASARVRLTGLVYGDQGLFLTREQFEQFGGYPEIRFMEDVFFSRVLRRHGRIGLLGCRIFVSPRRWQRTGRVRQTFRNWLLTGLAAGGVHPNRLASFYPQVR